MGDRPMASPQFYEQFGQLTVTHECPRCGDVHLSKRDIIPSLKEMAHRILHGFREPRAVLGEPTGIPLPTTAEKEES